MNEQMISTDISESKFNDDIAVIIPVYNGENHELEYVLNNI